MSERQDDSDWEEEEEESTSNIINSSNNTNNTTNPLNPSNTGITQSTATISTNPTIVPPAPTTPSNPPPSISSSPPSLLLAFPIQLQYLPPTLPSTAAIPTIPLVPAGVTLLNEFSQNRFILLFYDSNKRPVAVEQFDQKRFELEKSNKKSSFLPINKEYSFIEESEERKVNYHCLVGNQSTKWIIHYSSQQNSFQLYSHLCIISSCIRCSIHSLPFTVTIGEFHKGNGKSAKEEYFAEGKVKLWRVDIAGEYGAAVSKESLTPLSYPRSTDLASFRPSLSSESSTESTSSPQAEFLLSDIRVEELTEGNNYFPRSFGEIIHKMKVSGQRVFSFPFLHPIAQFLLDQQKQNTTLQPKTQNQFNGTMLFGVFTLTSIEKKKKEKKSKSNAPTQQSAESNANPSLNLTNKENPKQQSMNEAESHLSVESKEESSQHLEIDFLELDRQLTELLETLRSTKESHSQLPLIQQKLLKVLMGNFFQRVSGKLEENQKESYSKEEISEIISNELRSLLNEFKEKNSLNSVTGTIQTTVETFHSALHSFQSLIQGKGILSKETRRKLEIALKGLKTPKETGNKAKEQLLENSLAESQSLIEDLSKKQISLATVNIEMEEKLEKTRKELEETKEKLKLSSVFENGLMEMRKIFDSEMEGKRQLEEEFKVLQQIQSKMKFNFVPETAIKKCMNCRVKLVTSRITIGGGKKKHHCSCCGRVFCKECANYSIPLPEMGFKDKVKVCKNCKEWREEQNKGEEED